MRKSGYHTVGGVIDGLFRLPSLLAVAIIIFYQKTLSPDHGSLKRFFSHGYCRFSPSCSEYGRQAFLKYGLVRGLFFTAWRILRCNPFSRGGIDELR